MKMPVGKTPARPGWRRRVLVGALLATAVAVTVASVTPPASAEGPPAVARVRRDPVAAVEEDLRAGRYEQARRGAELLGRKRATLAVGARMAARAERHLGRLREARRRLEEASVKAPHDLPLRAELMRVVDALGDRGALADLVDESYGDWQEGRVDKETAANLVAMSVALRYDNNWKDANDLLRRAAKREEGALPANLEWGETFLEKHAPSDAAASFREVLARDSRHPDAQVGMARVLLEQSYDTAAAERAIATALGVNPRHAGALALRGAIALDAEDFEAVAATVATLRRTNRHDEEAAWLAAARALLLEDQEGYEKERAARMAVRPADADFLTRVAEALVRHRRYDEARALAAAAVDLDPKHARALSSLGNSLLRLGREDEGIATLRRAWERDPYDARTYNLLELFEKVIPVEYVIVATEHLRFRVEPAARPAIEAVVGPFLEETYRAYVARYGVAPAGPVTFELYRDPAHYAVRTVGLPRLGVTAVCFGRVITSQAPTNAAFNWGMVLAHELAHVFALELSRHRVPRWFTEGLAELEAARLRPEWRRRGSMPLGAALDRGALVSIGMLSQAFVRARDLEAATHAYMHSAVALEFLEARFGFAKIREALVAFGRGERTPAVLRTISKTDPGALDRAFRASLEQQLALYAGQFLPAQAARIAGADDDRGGAPVARAALRGLRALAAGDARAAREELTAARATGAESPEAAFLAGELALEDGETARADALFAGLAASGHDGYDVRVRLALAALRRKDPDAAAAHLRKAIAFGPEEVEARTLLAELASAGGRHEERAALEEAILRLEPQTASLAKRVVAESARRGDPKTAELAELALFIDPADPTLHAFRVNALAAAGDRAAAERAREQARRVTGGGAPPVSARPGPPPAVGPRPRPPAPPAAPR